MRLKHQFMTGLSWRLEARAAAMGPAGGARMRHYCGQAMRLTCAHDNLPPHRQQAAILCFHGVGISPDPDAESNVLDVRDFRKILHVLRRSFRVIRLSELVRAVREKGTLPPNSIAITFDDGYANNHTIAAEELATLKMPWSEFLPAQLIETGGRQWTDDLRLLIHRGRHRHLSLTWDDEHLEWDLTTRAKRQDAVERIIQAWRYLPESLRQPRFDALLSHYSTDEIESLRDRFRSFAPMTWQQARQLQTAGVDVGSHSLSHIALSPQTPQQIRHELTTARTMLQERLGDHSPHFSYPYGRPDSISPLTESVLSEMGYDCALTLEQNLVHCQGTTLLAMPRLIVPTQIGRLFFTLWQRFAQ